MKTPTRRTARCQACGNPMTWAAQRVQFGRLKRRGMSPEAIKAAGRRCQKCMTTHLASALDPILDDPLIVEGPTAHAAYQIALLKVRTALGPGGSIDVEVASKAAVAACLAAMGGRSEWSRETAAAVARRTVGFVLGPDPDDLCEGR